MASTAVFRRVEKKYIVTAEQEKMLTELFSPMLIPDKFKEYTICSLYYDTKDNDLIRRSVEKPEFKEKLRVRSYGIPKDTSPVFLEIKRKYDGTVYKRRITLTYKEACDYMERGEINCDGQILEEIEYFRSLHKVFPAMLVVYDRRAFCGTEDSTLRVTFDHNIRYRTDRLSLSEGDNGKRLIPEGLSVMEIKANGAMPLEMARILNEKGIYPSPFSKYGKAYIKETIEARKNLC